MIPALFHSPKGLSNEEGAVAHATAPSVSRRLESGSFPFLEEDHADEDHSPHNVGLDPRDHQQQAPARETRRMTTFTGAYTYPSQATARRNTPRAAVAAVNNPSARVVLISISWGDSTKM